MAGRTPLLFSLAVWGHGQFARPIMEGLRKRGGEKYSFYLSLDQLEDLPEGDLLGVARWRVRSYREYLPFGKRFAALLAPDIAVRHPPSECPTRVYLGHGIPAKFIHLRVERCPQYTHWFMQGPLSWVRQRDLAERAPEAVARVKWVNVGYPKSDELLARKDERDTILRQFGLDPKLPTVLYAPAFNRGGALERYGEDVFRTLASLQAVNVLVKLHPVSHDRSVVGAHSNGVYWPEVVDKYVGERFRHIGNVEVTESLLAADVLVCDVSGVALEYLLLDRPVVYLACPDFFLASGSPPDGGDNLLVNVGRPAGVEVDDMPGLERAVREALSHPEAHGAERRAIAEQLVYNPGHATQVAVDVVEQLLAESMGDKTTEPR